MASNRYSVEAIFKAVDRMSRPMRRMGINVLRTTKRMEGGLKRLDKVAMSTARGIKSTFKAVTKWGGAALVATGAGLGFVMSKFSQVEDAEAAFTPLLGSLEKAKTLVEDIQKTGATTPFEFKDLAESTRTLVAMGAATEENVIPTLRMLGDVAQGDNEVLKRLAINFGEITANGKAMTRDLRQFTTAGVPIMQEIANVMGMGEMENGIARVQDLASKGRISSKIVTQALKNMTSEGGKFHNAMEIANNTVTGLWSNLMDDVTMAAAEIGRGLAPTIKDLLRDLSGVAQQVREWAQANKGLIGSKFKEFVLFIKENKDDIFTWGKRLAWATGIIAGLIVVLKTLIAVLTVVNLVMATNPIVLITLAVIAGIAALSAFIYYIEEITAKFKTMSPIFKYLSLVLMGVIGGPIGLFIGAAAIIAAHWKELGIFFEAFLTGFSALWEKTKDNFLFVGIQIVEGIKNIFKTLFEVSVWPINQLLKVISTLGGDAVGDLQISWEGFLSFFVGMWDRLANAVKTMVEKVKSYFDLLMEAVEPVIEALKWIKDTGVGVLDSLGVFGGGEDGKASQSGIRRGRGSAMQNAPVVADPAPQTQEINNTTTDKSEITIKDETGRAEVTKRGKRRGNGSGFSLVRTGAF